MAPARLLLSILLSACGALAQDAAFVVRVLDKQGGKPVAGAAVWFADSSPDAQLRIRKVAGNPHAASRPSLVAMLQQAGERRLTDARGLVEVTATEGDVACACEHDGRSGVLMLKASPERAGRVHDLVLEPNDQFMVEVRDAHGRPAAAIPVGFEFTPLDPKTKQPPYPFPTVGTLGATESDGTMRNPSRQFLTQMTANAGAEPRGRVVANLPGADERGETLDLTAGEVRVVRLQLPELGALKVEVVDADGKPVTGRGVLLVDVADAREGKRFGWTVWLEAGVATLPQVAIGKTYRLCVRIGGREVRDSVVGPAEAGKQVSHRIAFVGAVPTTRPR